jgi:N-acetylmuramoyl-L-alanine amidase
MKSIETNDRKINDRTDLAVLKFAKMPSVIVEMGFLSNKKDVELLKTDEFRLKAATALAEGIKRSLSAITE